MLSAWIQRDQSPAAFLTLALLYGTFAIHADGWMMGKKDNLMKSNRGVDGRMRIEKRETLHPTGVYGSWVVVEVGRGAESDRVYRRMTQ
ncbi:hypothetical protein E1301_Tti001387 [Triplophysa tibetana]|uniref:Uncharacterized protein n=1 Tax=Triplophysa tibetana TaxID=1572043 RepID=A0A5A9PAG3_9TELE|nr:hypothetical protein E1301_Tti001387 [Triplophysa tibetana]